MEANLHILGDHALPENQERNIPRSMHINYSLTRTLSSMLDYATTDKEFE